MMKFQKLFNLLCAEYGVVLFESEMYEILKICREIIEAEERQEISITEKYLNKDVVFRTGNFAGLEGKCVAVDENCKDEEALFGVRLDFALEDGRRVRAYKSEHFELLEKKFIPF